MSEITLNPVRVFTDADVYHYTVENRPLLDLVANDEILKQAIEDIATTAGIEIENIATLRTIPPPAIKSTVYVQGYYEPGDGGGGTFLWMPTSTKVDNGGTVVIPDTAPSNGRWERGIPDELSVLWFGARAGFDSTVNIQAALDCVEAAGGGTVVVPWAENQYLLTGSLRVPGNTKLEGRGVPSVSVATGTGPQFRYDGLDAAIVLKQGEADQDGCRGISLMNIGVELTAVGATAFRLRRCRDVLVEACSARITNDNQIGFHLMAEQGVGTHLGVFDTTFVRTVSYASSVYTGVVHYKLSGTIGAGQCNSNTFFGIRGGGCGTGLEVGPSLVNSFYGVEFEALTGDYLHFLSGASENSVYDLYAGDATAGYTGKVMNCENGATYNKLVNYSAGSNVNPQDVVLGTNNTAEHHLGRKYIAGSGSVGYSLAVQGEAFPRAELRADGLYVGDGTTNPPSVFPTATVEQTNYSAALGTFTPNLATGRIKSIRFDAGSSGVLTIAAPTGSKQGDTLDFQLFNNSGGPVGLKWDSTAFFTNLEGLPTTITHQDRLTVTVQRVFTANLSWVPYSNVKWGGGDSVNVRRFGAIGDGNSHPLSERFATLIDAQAVYAHATALTDEIDWCAIQAAIKYVEGLVFRPTVVIPAGSFLVNKAIRISNDAVRIRGAGPGRSAGGGGFGTFEGGTVIKYTGSAMPAVPTVAQTGFLDCGVFTLGYFGYTGTLRSVQITDLAIFCENNGVGVYAADDWNMMGLLRNLYINKPTVGILVQDHGYSNRIEHVEVHGMTECAIRLDDNCHATEIVSCAFNALTAGTETPANYILIGKVGQSSNTSVVNCSFDPLRATDAVVRVKDLCKNFNFEGNYVEIHDTVTAACLIIESAIGVSVTGNRFTGIAGGTAKYAVDLWGNVNGCEVTGNYFSTFDTACVRIGNGAKYITVMSNGIADTTLPVNNQNGGTENHIFIYQEGAFTPTLLFGGAAAGMAGAFNGKYTLMGNRLLFNLRIALTAKGTSTGSATVGGLPYTSDAVIQQTLIVGLQSGFSGLTGVGAARVQTNSNAIILEQTGATGQTALTDTAFTDTAALNVSGQICL